MYCYLGGKNSEINQSAAIFFSGGKNFLSFYEKPTFYNKNVIILQRKKNIKAMKWNELRRIAEEIWKKELH